MKPYEKCSDTGKLYRLAVMRCNLVKLGRQMPKHHELQREAIANALWQNRKQSQALIPSSYMRGISP